MPQKPQKIDVSSARTPVSDSPFGALGELKTSLPANPVAPVPPRAEIIDEMAAFRVHKTRKGGWPVSFEKRAAGKLVTVIQQVSGDGNALLKLLRKHCATGGVYKDGAIELQGDHRAKVGAWFDKHLA